MIGCLITMKLKIIYKLAFISLFVFSQGLASAASGDAEKVIPVLQLLLLDDDPFPKHLRDDPASKMASQLNATNILGQAKNVDEDNYVDFYKRIKDLKVFGLPDLGTSFGLAKRQTNKSFSQSSLEKYMAEKDLAEKRTAKTLNCPSGGTVSEVINLIPRGTLKADTLKTGDDYKITYHNCKIGNITYNGTRRYHVNDFSNFDFSKVGAGDPIGKVTTTYNQYSVETSTQKTTLNGSFVYTGEASYPALPNTAPTSLTKQFSAVAGSTISYVNKSDNTQTVLSYDGVLDEIVYTKKLLTDNEYTYCRKANFYLTIEENSESAEVPIYELFCGDVAPYTSLTLWPPRIMGNVYDDVGAAVQVNGHRIVVFVLADGSTRYIFDNNFTGYSSISNEASTDSGQAIYNLPQTDSNLNLMEGVVVFAFEGCPGYDWLIGYLNDNNIEYTYIDVDNTSAANLAGWHWFGSRYVPYIGINGNYFLSTFTESRFKLEGLVE